MDKIDIVYSIDAVELPSWHYSPWLGESKDPIDRSSTRRPASIVRKSGPKVEARHAAIARCGGDSGEAEAGEARDTVR